MKEISLPYGKGFLKLPTAGLGPLEVAKPIAPKVSRTAADLLRRAFLDPEDSPPLTALLEGKKKVGIVIPDLTRYSGADAYLPIILELLAEIAVEERNVTLFVALGIHRRMTDPELHEITGGLSSKLKTVQNDPDGDLVNLGTTSRGTPVWINRELLENDAIIVTGTASFHYFAGFGGGRKMLVPGLAGRETCYGTHFRIFGESGRHPAARPGVLDGNPVHEDMLEAASFIPVTFTLTTCVTPDRKIFAAFGGTLNGSHRKACELYSRHFRVKIPKRHPLVIASPGGHPKDINFIQSHKALDYSYQALSPGGVLVLTAKCPDGLGHDDFFPWFRFEDLDEFERELRKNYVIYGQTAYATLTKSLGAEIILVSDLPEDVVRAMRMTPATDLDQALSIALERLGGRPESTLVIPEAGYVLPEPE